MSENYKPGTVVVATVRGVPDVRVMRCTWRWCSGESIGNHKFHDDGKHVTDVRPLVVLDLDGFEAANVVTSLRELADEAEHRFHWDLSAAELSVIADQIEAQTRPPKPAEPTGMGAVVEDSRGKHFVRIPDGDDHDVWFDNRGDFFAWESIDAVRVLSEGVKADDD